MEFVLMTNQPLQDDVMKRESVQLRWWDGERRTSQESCLVMKELGIKGMGGHL